MAPLYTFSSILPLTPTVHSLKQRRFVAQQIEIKSAAYLTMNEGSRRGLHLLN